MTVVRVVATIYIIVIILYTLFLIIFENNFDEYWEEYKEKYLTITVVAALCCLTSAVIYTVLDFVFLFVR